jgi:hypothetical protein
MGDANRRGTREDRIVQIIARKALAEEAKKEEARQWWAGLTDEEKEAQRKKWREDDKRKTNARMTLAVMMGIAASTK